MTKQSTSRKPVSVPVEVFVVHTLPDRKRLEFTSFKPAFAAFKLRNKQIGSGSVALWRGPQWTLLHSSETYPSALTQPYLNADV